MRVRAGQQDTAALIDAGLLAYEPNGNLIITVNGWANLEQKVPQRLFHRFIVAPSKDQDG